MYTPNLYVYIANCRYISFYNGDLPQDKTMMLTTMKQNWTAIGKCVDQTSVNMVTEIGNVCLSSTRERSLWLLLAKWNSSPPTVWSLITSVAAREYHNKINKTSRRSLNLSATQYDISVKVQLNREKQMPARPFGTHMLQTRIQPTCNDLTRKQR